MFYDWVCTTDERTCTEYSDRVRSGNCGCDYAFLRCKLQKKPEPDTLQKQDAPPEPVYTTATATVTDMACWVETVGIKQPKTVKRFQVVFETDGGEPVKLDVPEELYDAFEKGQTGTLTLVDGQLYGFEPAEEV